MKLTDLKSNLGEWLRGGPEGDVVVSSRIRLARNIEGYPFASRASGEQIAEIEQSLQDKILTAGISPELTYHRLDKVQSLLLELLAERHLISRDLAEGDWVRGVAFDAAERVSLMVNEEDHLRIQVVAGGYRLEEVLDTADAIDDLMASLLPFAFSQRYGFLTACPTNVGTGMRASVMLHLPALVMMHELDKVLVEVDGAHLALRGLFGEGTHASGDLFQISNQVTLGVTAQGILGQVATAVESVVEMEREARQSLLAGHPQELRERMGRVLKLLTSVVSISSEEALHLLSFLRLGVYLGLLSKPGIEALNGLFLLTLPAHLQTMEGRRVDNLKRNELRANCVREKLGSVQ